MEITLKGLYLTATKPGLVRVVPKPLRKKLVKFAKQINECTRSYEFHSWGSLSQET